MGEHDEETAGLRSRLRAAVEGRRFELHFQPIVDLGLYAIHAERPDALVRSVRGAEALLRWRDGSTLRAPASFLAALEAESLMDTVDEWTVGEALRVAREWLSAGLDLEIWINLSARSLEQLDLPAQLARAAAAAAGDPKRFVIEVPRSAGIGNYERTAAVLDALARFGFRLALDDFGVGDSSLARLLRLPIDSLKIDGSFLAEVATDQPARRMAAGIIALGRACGHVNVAEWVETREQCDFLIEHGCELGQGFYFLPPVEAARLVQLLAPTPKPA